MRDHPLHAAPSLASGSMAGNITRLPLSSITFGRPWCWASHVLQTTLILRSHSGPGTGEFLLGAPTGPEFRVEPQLFRTLVLERLRLPLDVTESKCECGCFLDHNWKAPGSLPEIWQTPHKSSRSRKDFGQECAGKQGPQFASRPSSVI